METKPQLKAKLQKLPNKPGVYLMRDRLGRVIYVGKAKSLSKRVRSYFQLGRMNHLDPKTKALISMITDLDFHQVRNEAEAILLEGKLIKEYRPKYNISFRDDKRFLLVKLTREDYPRFVLARLRKPDGCRYFGPFINAGAVRNTMTYIRRHFHILSQTSQGQVVELEDGGDVLKYSPPLRVQQMGREEYMGWVEKACAFLEGKDEEVLQKMEEEMKKAAVKKEYEKAASLRDTLHDLRVTVKQSGRKFAREMPRRMDTHAELISLAEVLGLKNSPEIIEAFDISHIYGRHTVGSMVHFVKGKAVKAQYRHFNIRGRGEDEMQFKGDPSSLIDDFASIREIVGRRYRRLKEEGKALPDLVLIDGGRGQLNSALLALREVGVELSVIGLAKENEEIYLPDQERPLRLERSSIALQLLQRIRDESHRFANTLHKGWRQKQIRESMLDEIPGIGAERKKALLKRFGSLEKIRQASLEELSSVEGFGRKKAEVLFRFLCENRREAVHGWPSMNPN